MNYVASLVCTACGESYPANRLMNLCEIDNRPVQMVIDIDAIQHDWPDNTWFQPEAKSMWRFGALMGFDLRDDAQKESIVTLGEGHTPEVSLQGHPLAIKYGIDLSLKDEGQPHPGYGCNPTGSFKDRGMSMAITMAKSFGVKKVVVPTQGNAGDSMVEYAKAAGLEGVVIMPDDTPMPILGRVAAMASMHDQFQLELVKGTIANAGALMKEKYLPKGYFNLATFQEPGWRIEGKKSLGLELAEPKAPGAPWSLPDVVLYPTGGGTGILGMWKAFDEFEALGLIDSKRPHIIAVQSEVTTPVVTAFQEGKADTQLAAAGYTLATGINVPGGVGHFRVLEIVRQSKGAALAVAEAAIAEQLRYVYQNFGIWICPEGAATLAAIDAASSEGFIEEGDRVVCFNTGSFEKYLPNVRHLLFG